MAKYLRLFQTVAEKEAATLDYPNVNYTIENNSLEILESAPVPPAFGGLTVKYNIADPTVEVTLFKGGGGSSSSSSSSSSESGSGGGGVMPTRMIVDGNEETPINTWRFETAGEHVVQYEFEDNTVPLNFLLEITIATEAIIGDDITEIGNTAFYGCSSLASVSLGSGVTSIGDGAFGGCNLINIIVPDSVTSIGSAAFDGCSSLASVSLGSGVTSIGSSAFYGCKSLTSVTIPDSVTSIGEEAFSSCSGLTSVNIPSGVTSIGRSTFNGCRNLTSVTIPDSVTSIGAYAFRYCFGLTSVTIPDSITSIGNSAFADSNHSLASVTVNATTPPTLGDNVFYDSALNFTIYVPAASVNTYKEATGWSDFSSSIQPIS